ncbi:MAG: heme exporter protein CcmB, partial [Casimicrobiaceae bacterium]
MMASTAPDGELLSPAAWRGVAWAVRRDARLALRSKAELGVQLLFYVLVVTLVPLGVGADAALLRALGPGVLWVAALLASLLALPRLFAMDFADGTLEQMVLSPSPLPALISGKIAAHWLATGLPLVAASPFLGLQFGLGRDELAVLALGLLLGTPTLSLLGGVGAALTLGLKNGALLALLVLPLYVPILIFGAGAVDA